MRMFELFRREDATGTSGTGTVAEGVQFADGSCVLRWRTKVTSTAFYANVEDLQKIHGHNGMTEVIWINDPFLRGGIDALQDRCENAPFNCVGGLSKRVAPVLPKWIASVTDEGYRKDWLRGYLHRCRELFGEDWATCEFGWTPAIRIGGDDEPSAPDGGERG